MKIEDRIKFKNERYKVGNLLISKCCDYHLIVQNEEGFEVFDLNRNFLRYYQSVEDFENDYETDREIQSDNLTLNIND